MAKEPNPKYQFDLSDVGTEAPKTPKKKRARSAPPVPVEAYRPRGAAKKEPISSEGRPSAAVSGEISLEEDEQPYSEIVIETAPEPAAAKLTPSMEAARGREDLRAQAIELHDAYQDAQAEFNRVQDLTAKRSQEIGERLSGKNYDADTIAYLTDAIYRKEGLNEMYDEALGKLAKARAAYESSHADWEKALGPKLEAEEANDVIEEIVASHRQPDYTAREEAWFKQGKEDESRQMAEARATIERGGKSELMVETAADIDANVKEAETLFKGGDLSPRDFSVEDYAYLLKERVRVDKELEDAGWWKARKLRKELGQIMKGGYNGAPNGLDDYEKQITDAKTGKLVARRAEADEAARRSGAPEKKPSFWERLRAGKGR